MIISEENYLAHYGILRKSGRYPWGSGETQSERNSSFLATVEGLKKDGMSESEIAKGFGMSSTDLRALRSIAVNEQRQSQINMAQRLKDKGYSNGAIGERMGGLNESTVRGLLAPGSKDRADVLVSTANMLKDQVADKEYIDIGSGVENQLGITSTKLSTAVAMLKEEGYRVHTVVEDQIGTGAGQKTKIKVLTPPGTEYRDVASNKDKIQQINAYSENHGRSFDLPQPPLNVSSKRVAVRYKEEGGAEADGVIYVRPGVQDLSLGGKNYAQVRIAVDGTHYLKGMAMYKDDLPPGVDLMFNTNKKSTGNKLDAMKKQSLEDPINPFGSVTRQLGEVGPDGKKRVTSAMNIVNEEGNWDKWNRNLSTQVLSKQSPVLAKQQLDLTYERKRREYDEIMALTNPVVKKKLLQEFSDGVDASAVHMKAAAMPRQATQVILPINTLKPNEIYAPNFRNGERVALIRYPHGGTFEIPELVVNNNHKPAQKLMGKQAKDAVGINHKVAERLSGADFDGDTVLVIPNNAGQIKTTPALQGLKNFDPQGAYPAYPGMKPMSARTKGIQMGLVSNLITDMTIQGASPDELARAVRHSMVVIDAEKHKLDYRQSAKDNGIAALNAKYQPRADGRTTGGASSLFSRAKSPTEIVKRAPRPAQDGGPIDKRTGEKVYVNVGKTYTQRKINKRTGEVTEVERVETEKVKKLELARDAKSLISAANTPIENVYAEHSNRLKALANEARRGMVNTNNTPYSPSAKAAYANEVRALNAKLNTALRNRPLERQAQVIANAQVNLRRQANPNMDAAELKKIKSQELAKARARTGAGKEMIDPTPQEWAAIQAGAISTNKLEQILQNSRPERIKELATPRTPVPVSPTAVARARSMISLGYTQSDIADALGVSTSTLSKALEEG